MSGEKVLVIDDSDALRSLLESILPYGGYEAICAGTGELGLQLVLEAQPDVIMTDLELPDITGLELLEELKQQGTTIPTIMMTAYGSEGVAAQALKLGVRDYLVKPFTTEEVLAAIERALNESRLQSEKVQLTTLLKDYVYHFRLLGAVGHFVTSDLNLDHLLRRIVEACRFVTRAETGFLLLLDEASGQLRVVAAEGQANYAGQSCSALAGDKGLHSVLKEQAAVRFHSPPNSTLELQTGDRVKAVLQVPLRGSSQSLGLLSVDRRVNGAPFDKHDEQMLTILADYAVIALDRNRHQIELDTAQS